MTEVDSNKEAAEAAKAKGNDAYKAKNFEEALGHYTEAISLDGDNIVYYLNRAAVYFAQKDWDKCADGYFSSFFLFLFRFYYDAVYALHNFRSSDSV